MLRYPPLAGHIDKEWGNVVQWNLKLFQGLSQYHASFEHADAYEYGKQVDSPCHTRRPLAARTAPPPARLPACGTLPTAAPRFMRHLA